MCFATSLYRTWRCLSCVPLFSLFRFDLAG
jgi:hypothetical protein